MSKARAHNERSEEIAKEECANRCNNDVVNDRNGLAISQQESGANSPKYLCAMPTSDRNWVEWWEK